MAQHLAILMLAQALWLHLADAQGGVGWLFAVADKRMRVAITAMHDDPARRWTLQELAAHAGLSRSSLALRFRQTVGASPMGYLAPAHDAGGKQAQELQRSGVGHRGRARLRVGRRVQHRLQAADAPPAAAVAAWRGERGAAPAE